MADRFGGARKKATNVSVRSDLLAEARDLVLSISAATEDGLERAIPHAREQRWLDQNRTAIESSNTYVEEHGLPLGQHRQF